MKRLLDYSDCPRDIADPWYTGKFELTYSDVEEGCQALLNTIQRNNSNEETHIVNEIKRKQ